MPATPPATRQCRHPAVGGGGGGGGGNGPAAGGAAAACPRRRRRRRPAAPRARGCGGRRSGFGEPYDRPDDYCRLSPSTIAEATRHLTNLIVDKWETTYLRRPTEDELKHILTRNAARGMPGCIGSIDRTHWQWLKCPKALAGQYHDRKGKRSVVVESICDEDTYI